METAFGDFESAEKEWEGRAVIITTEQAETRFTMVRGTGPRIFSSDAHGRIVTGFLHGEAKLMVSLRRFPVGCVRIFVVRRRYGWHCGDPIEPVSDVTGRPVVKTVEVGNQETAIVEMVERGQIEAGSYQFIARAFRPGWWRADDDRLLADDIVSNRRFASLVIRVSPKVVGWIENGVILTHEEAKTVLLPAHDPKLPAVAGICVMVTGEYFPQRAVEPELLVDEIAADFTRISVDQHTISGFFRKPLAEGGRVRYGDRQEGEVEQRFSSKSVQPLPRECGQ